MSLIVRHVLISSPCRALQLQALEFEKHSHFPPESTIQLGLRSLSRILWAATAAARRKSNSTSKATPPSNTFIPYSVISLSSPSSHLSISHLAVSRRNLPPPWSLLNLAPPSRNKPPTLQSRFGILLSGYDCSRAKAIGILRTHIRLTAP